MISQFKLKIKTSQLVSICLLSLLTFNILGVSGHNNTDTMYGSDSKNRLSSPRTHYDADLQPVKFESSEMVLDLPSLDDESTMKESALSWEVSAVSGAPELPVKHLKVLLPPNVDPSTIRVEVIEEQLLSRSHNAYFAPAPIPVALLEDRIYVASESDQSYVYNENVLWPHEFINNVNVGQLRDAKIVEFDYYPIQFNPVLRTAVEHRDVKISINWEKTDQTALDSLTSKMLENVGDSLYNYDDVAPYYKPSSVTSETTYLIITTNAIESNSGKLDDFVAHKQLLGFNTCVITEDEYGSTTGQQRAINIRTWLQNNYVADSIEYVLLIGDPDPDDIELSDSVGDVPMMMCWPRNNKATYRQSATDYFYADLTGNWDTDSDTYYGEEPDDSGVDFNAEVYVGRIPVYSADYASLDTILQNSIDHHDNAGSEKTEALVPIAISNYLNEDNQGASFYRTDGLNLPGYFYNNTLSLLGMNDTVMHERSGLNPVPTSAFHHDMALTDTNVINELNSGQGAILWWGHGSSTGVFRKYWASDDGDGVPESGEMTWTSFLDSGDMSSLQSDQPGFFYQSSCQNGEPEVTNNLGYALLKKGAAATTVSASRVSWYAVGTWSPMQSLSDNTGLGYYYMYSLLHQNLTAGEALYTTTSVCGNGWAQESRMNKMDFNLYGDPQLDYWGSAKPSASNPSPPDSGAGTVGSCNLEVDVYDADGDTLCVMFYNASDDTLIGKVYNVASGSTPSVVWSNINDVDLYQWYVVVTDGQRTSNSSTWSFTGNDAPSKPTNPLPLDTATDTNLSVTLNVTVHDDDSAVLNASFYDASDDTLIGTDINVNSDDNATMLWTSLAENTTYSWYVIVDDGTQTNQSDTWSFTTLGTMPTWDETPTDQIIAYNTIFTYDVNASDISGIDEWWINDSTNFGIDSDGLITNSTMLDAGSYWIEIRAYDPADNYCAATIKIDVQEEVIPVSEFSDYLIPVSVLGGLILFAVALTVLIKTKNIP